MARSTDWGSIRAMATLLQKRPHTIAELMESTGAGQRTVYRWLDTIQESGADLVRRNVEGLPTFQILGEHGLPKP